MKPTEDQVKRAVKLRADGLSWREVGVAVHCHPDFLRDAIIPGYREIRLAKKTAYRRNNRSPKRLRKIKPVHGNSLAPQIPDRVMVEWDRNCRAEYQTLTAFLMRDPLPGRSALDQVAA